MTSRLLQSMLCRALLSIESSLGYVGDALCHVCLAVKDSIFAAHVFRADVTARLVPMRMIVPLYR